MQPIGMQAESKLKFLIFQVTRKGKQLQLKGDCKWLLKLTNEFFLMLHQIIHAYYMALQKVQRGQGRAV